MPMTEAKIPVTSAIAVPRHVAIIMDGNGRWAAARGLPRVEGHRRGVEAVRRTVRAATEIVIQYLTIFAFSAENWTRPASEIGELMGLLRRFIRNDLADLHKANVRVRVIGEREGLAPDGARQEIVRAARRLAEEVAAGALKASNIDLDRLTQALDAPDLPDPDLIIRTSGEQRLSNFLLWQSALL